jgi:hypothetical protein
MLGALLLIAALAGPAAPAAPQPAHCLFTKAGDHYEGSCGPLFEDNLRFLMRSAKAIATGEWRREQRPESVWTLEAPGPDAPSQPIEVEVYAGGSGVLRDALGWFAVSGFVPARDTLKFDLDLKEQVPPNDLDRSIVERAAAILSSDAVWNRADDRQCKPDAKTWSIYCALERATVQLTGGFHHRRPALEVVRAIVEERAAGRPYQHRLMDYNNDPSTHLQDVQSLFTEAVGRIDKAAPPAQVRLEVKSLTPAAGSALNEYSILVAVLDYTVGDFEPDRYFVQVAFVTGDPNTFMVANDSSVPKEWILRKSAGTVKVSQPLRSLWKDPHLAHPIKAYFQLSERVDRGSSHVLLTLGPIDYSE